MKKEVKVDITDAILALGDLGVESDKSMDIDDRVGHWRRGNTLADKVRAARGLPPFPAEINDRLLPKESNLGRNLFFVLAAALAIAAAAPVVSKIASLLDK